MKIRPLLMSLSLATGLVVAAAVVGVDAARDGSPDTVPLATTTAADPTDGHAYAKEAVENLRASGTFAFTQVLHGPSSTADLKTGDVVGAVDLAQKPGDLPKYHSRLTLKTPKGEDVALESVAIGEDVHVKGPKQNGYRPSPQKAKKGRGKGAGGAGQVDVVDPVLQLLEPVDTLPAAAFGAPSAPDADGRRSVQVTLPQASSLVLLIDDATRQLAGMTFTRGETTATYVLTKVGDPANIPDPTP